jgi:membrane associated rhomboid family serine protease
MIPHIGSPTMPQFMANLFHEIYKNIPRHMLTRNFVYSLALLMNEKNPSIVDSEWYTFITHMFVHTNYQHMFSNLKGLVMCGTPTFTEFGPFGVYGIFLCGGVFSSMPSIDVLYQRIVLTDGNRDANWTLYLTRPWESLKRLGLLPHKTLSLW